MYPKEYGAVPLGWVCRVALFNIMANYKHDGTQRNRDYNCIMLNRAVFVPYFMCVATKYRVFVPFSYCVFSMSLLVNYLSIINLKTLKNP
jgi:hypothetical protein